MKTRRAAIKRRIITFGVATAVALAAWGLTTSYAWYAHLDSDIGIASMGAVIVDIGNDSKVDKNGIATFEISNDSTIDIYLRLGWTPIYKSDGNELPKDTGNVRITDVQLTGPVAADPALGGIKLISGHITSLDGYIKRMITAEDGDGKYFVIPAGTSVTGQAKVVISSLMSEEPESLSGGENHAPKEELYIVFVPEALQATKTVVAEAWQYGWDTDKVGAQAGAIVSEPNGGDEL